MIKDTDKCNEVVKQLRDALNKAIMEKRDLNSKLLYLQADFQNFANRSRRNAEELVEKREIEIIADMVEVLDELEITYVKAREKIKEQDFIDGLGIIISKFQKRLSALGVTAIDPLGEKFDPTLHTAISTAQVDDPKLEGTVVEVLRKGYMVNKRLIRAAVVKVGVIKGD